MPVIKLWRRVKYAGDVYSELMENGYTVEGAALFLDHIPDAKDVVEVVRCKDCEHWCRNSGIAESPNGHCFHHDIETNGYDFCSYGAKMDGDANG